MKYVFIIPSITNYHTFLSELSYTLTCNKNEVTIITSSQHLNGGFDSNHVVNGKLKLVNIPRNINFYDLLTSSIKILLILRKIKPDIVHGHFLITIPILCFCKLFLNSIFICTLHGVNSQLTYGYKKYLFLFVEIISVKLLDYVFVINNIDKNYLSKYGCFVHLLGKYGIGCDLSRFKLRTNNYTSVSSTIRMLLSSSFVFVFVGRFVKHKGFDLTIRSFFKHLKHHKDSKLLTIGDFDSIHDSGLSSSEISDFKRNKSIINVSWTNKVEDYLQLSDAMVFPSFREGVPVCIMESISVGIPVITIDSRGCNDLIEDNYNGFITKPNPTHISLKMNVLVSDPPLLGILKKNCLLGRHKLCRNIYINNQMKFYKKILH